MLKAREDIVVHLKERAQDRLAELGKPGQEYETLLQQLILQVHCPFQEPANAYLCDPFPGALEVALKRWLRNDALVPL